MLNGYCGDRLAVSGVSIARQRDMTQIGVLSRAQVRYADAQQTFWTRSLIAPAVNTRSGNTSRYPRSKATDHDHFATCAPAVKSVKPFQYDLSSTLVKMLVTRKGEEHILESLSPIFILC